MQLTRAERFMIANQLKILRNTGGNPGMADRFSKEIEALESGYEREYDGIAEKFGISESVLTSEDCKEVWDTFQMFDSIRCSMEELNLDNIDGHEHRFKGYCGNEEANFMSYAQYIVKSLERFVELDLINPNDHDGFNSHHPMRASYAAMLNVWKNHPFYQSNEQIVAVLSAR